MSHFLRVKDKKLKYNFLIFNLKMNRFNDLPSELRRRILEEIDDVETISRASQVSKEWRMHLQKSKLQKQLDKYFFFYYIWYDDINAPPFPPSWEYNWGNISRFIFPISTEEQYTILKKFGTTKNSQVVAIAKHSDLLHTMVEMNGPYAAITYLPKVLRREPRFGNTEELVARVKTVSKASNKGAFLGKGGGASKTIYQYLQHCINITDTYGLVFAHAVAVKVKFSSQKEMERLLKDEHIILSDDSKMFFIKPRNYTALEKKFGPIKNTTFRVAKSLIIPRWAREIKP